MSFIVFTNLLGTVSSFVVATYLMRYYESKRMVNARLLQFLYAGAYGLLAIYGTHTAVQFETAYINVRDIAPLAAGLMFGPVAGIGAGLIGGIERYFQGGFTALPCCVATIFAGVLAGLIWQGLHRNTTFFHRGLLKPVWGLVIGILTELCHMGLILLLRLDDTATAWNIVRHIALPMILLTTFGLALLLWIVAIETKVKSA